MNKDYFKQLREKRKSLGICLSCGKYPTPCLSCRERNKLYMRNKRAGIPTEARKESWKTKRDYYLKYKYGIDENTYNDMLAKQNYCCAICKSPNTKDKSMSKLVIDHCHKTNKVRGLLCSACNKAIGLFEDSVNSLEKAIKYLSN
jgi:hypothetical protein